MNTSIPRLELADLREDLRQYLNETKVQRLGYLGEFFKCTAHNPDLLLHFMAFTDAFNNALPKKMVELVALTVAATMRNDYEKHQHERLSDKLGFGRAWIADVLAVDPAAGTTLDANEKAVQRYVQAALASNGIGVDAEFNAVIAALGPQQAMAVVMLAGRYVCHALTVNTLGLAPPVASIFTASTPAPSLSR